MEGDAIQVVKLLEEDNLDWIQWGILIQDAKELLNSFANWFASHVRREANQVTHLLARDATNLDVDIFYFHNVLIFIKHAIGFDHL